MNFIIVNKTSTVKDVTIINKFNTRSNLRINAFITKSDFKIQRNKLF